MPEILLTLDQQSGSVMAFFLDAVSAQMEASAEEIEGLRALIDARACPAEFLDVLAGLLTLDRDPSWDEEQKRRWLTSVVAIYMAKGQVRSLDLVARVRGEAVGLPIIEQWKSTEEEYADYSDVEDAGHTIKAARFRWTAAVSDEVRAATERVRPIHVLPLFDLEKTELDDDADSVDDDVTAGAGMVVEDEIVAVDDGESVIDTDTVYPPSAPCDYAGLQITLVCTAWCETSCQDSCQIPCQITCQTGTCEVDCQSFCQQGCQSMCEYACQESCEGTCEDATCQYSCQWTCQNVCQEACEIACETGCEVACEPMAEVP